VTLCYLPPLQLTDDSVLSENRERKGAFLGELSQRVPAVKVIQMTENGCSNEEEIFADTLYHLTQKGAEAFTRKIAPLVKEAIRVQEKP